ncbi:UDP-N-acetylglucosamine acyltransferase [Lyngbya sp. PCC 8106]|nr:UDP-N-acetylglucosamine acyltransferase [Lyngbya sp. PCC 8106]
MDIFTDYRIFIGNQMETAMFDLVSVRGKAEISAK